MKFKKHVRLGKKLRQVENNNQSAVLQGNVRRSEVNMNCEFCIVSHELHLQSLENKKLPVGKTSDEIRTVWGKRTRPRLKLA